jgi:hypothetical protein
MRKDLREMLHEAQALGVSLLVAARTLSCFDEGSLVGAGRIDGTQYPAWWIGHAQEAEHVKRPDILLRPGVSFSRTCRSPPKAPPRIGHRRLDRRHIAEGLIEDRNRRLHIYAFLFPMCNINA